MIINILEFAWNLNVLLGCSIGLADSTHVGV
jgi:hypothetical protein